MQEGIIEYAASLNLKSAGYAFVFTQSAPRQCAA